MPLASLRPWLATLDDDVLHWINCGLSSSFWDDVLLTLQSKSVGIPVMLVALLVVAIRDRRLGLRALTTALLAYGICMGIASVSWTLIDRTRPGRAADVVLQTPAEIATCERQPAAVVVRKHVSRHPGMPSRHALSAGVFAMSLFLAVRWLGVVGILYALLVAVGRVYAGVHWPSDVLVGLVVGGLVAWGAWRLVPRLYGRIGRRHLVAPPAPALDSTEVGGPPGTSG